MNNETQKVEVLAVMDRQIKHTKQCGGSPSFQTMEQARAAVAELIEADKEFDEAYSRHYHCLHYEQRDDLHATRLSALAGNLRATRERRRTVLARIGGSA